MTRSERIEGYSKYIAAKQASASLGYLWEADEQESANPDTIVLCDPPQRCYLIHIPAQHYPPSIEIPSMTVTSHGVATLQGERLQDVIQGVTFQNVTIGGRIRLANVGSGSETTLGQAETESVSLEGSESPFDQLFQKKSDEEKIRDLIEYVRTSRRLPFAEQLANRLEFLLEAGMEEQPEEFPISPESLRACVAFLQSEAYLKYPDVVLSPAGNIRAQWRVAPNRLFAVEFLSTGDVRFVVFAPGQERTLRLAGITSTDSLMDVVKPHNVLSWATAE